MGVLILNATYEPLGVIPAKRAVTLVLQEKVTVLAESDQEFRGAYQGMNVPTVVRLNYMAPTRARRTRTPLTKRGVLARDRHVCQFTHCNRKAETVDHVHPDSKGGPWAWTNLVAACKRCNSKKSDKSLQQLNWKLKREPFEPKGTSWVALNYKVHPDWKPYLPDVADI